MSGPWFIYILRCADGSLYTGISNDLSRRVDRHNSGRGAKYVRTRLPVELVWWEYAGTCSTALRREAAIKGYSRGAKERLIQGRKRNSTKGSLQVLVRVFHL